MNIRIVTTATKYVVAASALIFTAVSSVSPSGDLHGNSAHSQVGLAAAQAPDLYYHI